MKKKLTVNTLAVGNLKQRKKQYTIMIIGIILAMTFTSGVLFSLFSLITTSRETAINAVGNQDMILCNTSEDVVETAVNDGIIGEYGYAHTIGYGYTSKEEYENGVSIAWMDDHAKTLSHQSVLEGRYPEKEGELAIERIALIRLGINAQIGDEIEITLSVQDKDSYISEPVVKKYTLVGILCDKRSNITLSYSYIENDRIPAAFVCPDTQTELGGKEKLSCYFRLAGYTGYYYKDPLYYEALNYFRNHTIDTERMNSELIEINRISRSYARSGGDVYDNVAFACILGVVLMAASCLTIINAFNTNLKERKKQIGMLRAVGTTKRQIIKIFGREAFIISLICTPISTVLSYCIVLALSGIFGDDFVMADIWILIVCAILGIAAVMLAALIPLIAATKITPMQAIRNIDINRKMKNRKIKSQKNFSVPKLLAKRNMIFYKGGRIAVSFILIVTIAASFFGFSTLEYNKNHINSSYPFDYALTAFNGYEYDYANYKSVKSGISDYEVKEIEAAPYIESVCGTKVLTVNLMIDEYSDYFKILSDYSVFDWNYSDELTRDNFCEKVLNEKSSTYKNILSQFGYSTELFPTHLYSMDHSQLKKLESCLTDGEINPEKLSSGEEIILVAPHNVAMQVEITDGGYGGWNTQLQYDDTIDTKTQPILTGECAYKAGDKIKLSMLDAYTYEEGDTLPNDTVRTDKEVTIGAIISPDKIRGDSSLLCSIYDNFACITTTSGMNQFSENEKFRTLYILAQTEVDENVENEIVNMLQPLADKNNGSITSNYAMAQLNKQNLKTMFITMLAIIILGFAICASIVNNSLTARIRENKKEIGTLRAVGMNQQDLVHSYIRQLLSIFGCGYGIGFGIFLVGYLITFLVYKFNDEKTMPFIFSPWITILFCMILFAVCSINLWLKIRKEMKNSIIDNIREL